MVHEDIRLYQIYYLQNQLQHIVDTIPYDNSMDKSGMCEYGVFMKEYNNFDNYKENYIGFISWKFNIKTKKQPVDFYHFIENHPGYDLYAMQPWGLSKFHKGIWKQGDDYCQPSGSIVSIVNDFSKKLSLKNIIDDKSRLDKTILCNYWVGTKKVWQDYMAFTLPIAQYMIDISKTDDSLRKRLFQRTTNQSSTWGNLFPYIMERLITSFLISRPDIKTKIWHLADNIIL